MASVASQTYHEAMRARISATELGRELAAVLNRVRLQGQSFLIEQDAEAVATLEASRGVTWRTLTETRRDLPDGDVDFVTDLEEVQRNQSGIPAIVWPN